MSPFKTFYQPGPFALLALAAVAACSSGQRGGQSAGFSHLEGALPGLESADLSPEDKEAARTVAGFVLETGQDGAVVSWSNATTGRSGTFAVGQTTRSLGGRCRTIAHRLDGNDTSTASAKACKTGQLRWAISE